MHVCMAGLQSWARQKNLKHSLHVSHKYQHKLAPWIHCSTYHIRCRTWYQWHLGCIAEVSKPACAYRILFPCQGINQTGCGLLLNFAFLRPAKYDGGSITPGILQTHPIPFESRAQSKISRRLSINKNYCMYTKVSSTYSCMHFCMKLLLTQFLLTFQCMGFVYMAAWLQYRYVMDTMAVCACVRLIALQP